MIDVQGPLLWAAYFSLGALSLALLAAFYRVVRGPSLADRAVAIDFAGYVIMGFLATYAVVTEEPAYLDAALVLGLLAFLGTIALARYVEQVEAKRTPR